MTHSHVCHVMNYSTYLMAARAAFSRQTPLYNTLQHAAAHCNTLQHTAIHCDTLQHPTTHCNTLQHTATQCDTLQHTATHWNTLQHTAFTRGDELWSARGAYKQLAISAKLAPLRLVRRSLFAGHDLYIVTLQDAQSTNHALSTAHAFAVPEPHIAAL